MSGFKQQRKLIKQQNKQLRRCKSSPISLNSSNTSVGVFSIKEIKIILCFAQLNDNVLEYLRNQFMINDALILNPNYIFLYSFIIYVYS